ncbi:hypothetical protein [Mucilaginibacter panaciglaebae]
MTSRRQQIKQWFKEVLEDDLQGVSYFIFGFQAKKNLVIGISSGYWR